MIASDILRASSPAPDSHPRPLLTWAALAYAAAYLLWSAFGDATDEVRTLLVRVVYLPLTFGAALVFLRASAASRAGAGMQPTLRFLAAAGFAAFLGNAIVVVRTYLGVEWLPAALSTASYLAAYPLSLAALLVIPGGRRTSDRWKLLCDAGMVVSGAGVALWYFVLRMPAPGASATSLDISLIYPLADLLVLVGLTTIVLRQPSHAHRVAVRWLAASTALLVAADLSFNVLYVRTGQRQTLWIDALFMAYCVAQLAAAERFSHGPVEEAEPGPAQRLLAARLRSLLPIAAAGATYALLLVVALRQWSAPLSGLAIGAIAVSLFLGARQLLAFRRDASILAEQAVRASEARFRSLVQNSSDLIFELDDAGIIRFASSSAARVVGYEPEELVGRPVTTLVCADDLPRVSSYLEAIGQIPGISPTSEWRLCRPDGESVPVEVLASNLLDDPTVRGVVLNARDIGERKALLDQLAHQAFHDPLTGLANRALFYDRVSHALALARRHGRTVMVLYLDLDDFKQINDTLGHAEGDRLLTMFAARLRASARVTDTVARLGGDEFALLVEDDRADEGGLRLVDRIHEQMSFPFTLAGAEVRVGASIGSATGDDGGVDEILRRADLAMYAAKRSEKGTHKAYHASLLER